MNCPNCGSNEFIKDGKVRQRQRYQCKRCSYRYTVQRKASAKSKAVKRQALQLYLEGLTYREIGKIFGVSHVSVQKWVINYEKSISYLKNEQELSFIKIDEIANYVKSKQTAVK
ncbi:IS1 family transposase, partial [Bacteroidales bacterium AH-315-I05]|nr:IS1 family transposase [Bacteroidales bacterium AH-315-I05]